MSVDFLFRYATHMPSLPKLVQEIIQGFNDPGVNADLVAKKIILDQALTAKVLRLANSSFYGGRRKIESANDAVVMLGFDALRNLVISSAVAGAFQTVASHIDFNAFWRKSYMVAGIAKWLVKRCGVKSATADTAFTAGMLHDIGVLLLHALEPEKADVVDKAVAAGTPRGDAEQQVFGCTSPEVGAELARRWYFPASLSRALAEQNSPLLAAEPSPYALATHTAKTLYLFMLSGQPAENLPSVVNPEIAKALGLDLALVQANWAETADLAKDVDALLVK